MRQVCHGVRHRQVSECEQGTNWLAVQVCHNGSSVSCTVPQHQRLYPLYQYVALKGRWQWGKHVGRDDVAALQGRREMLQSLSFLPCQTKPWTVL